MKKLYVVSTYYHALISCIKQLLNYDKADILCTGYIPEGESLSDKIKKSGIFDKIYYVGKINEYKSINKLDYIFFYHRKNAKTIEKQFFINLNVYDEINIFHDNTWFAHYLKDKKIKYRLIEDALDSFKYISKSNFSFMLNNSCMKSALKKFFGIGYVYCGYDNCTIEVEVNNKNNIEIARFAGNKLVEIPRDAMFNALTPKDRNVLKSVFLKDMPEVIPEKTVLLLTQPFCTDGILNSEEDQIKLYKQLVMENTSGISDEQLVIKPHPRDYTDYVPFFPAAVILNKNMPVEILGLKKNEKFSKILSIDSTSAKFLKAKKYYTIKGTTSGRDS